MLALELSDRSASVAVGSPGGTITVEPLAHSRRSGDGLLCSVQMVLERAGIAREELAAIGLSRGPGSFTGLRVAIATAKMMAMALGVEIISIPTALGVAVATNPDGPALIALSAKHDSAWVSRATRDGRWSVHTGSIMTSAEFSVAIHDGAVTSVVGDDHLPDSFHRACTEHGVSILPPIYDAGAVLGACLDRWKDGEIDDPMTLLPLYPRMPEAVRIHQERKSE